MTVLLARLGVETVRCCCFARRGQPGWGWEPWHLYAALNRSKSFRSYLNTLRFHWNALIDYWNISLRKEMVILNNVPIMSRFSLYCVHQELLLTTLKQDRKSDRQTDRQNPASEKTLVAELHFLQLSEEPEVENNETKWTSGKKTSDESFSFPSRIKRHGAFFNLTPPMSQRR